MPASTYIKLGILSAAFAFLGSSCDSGNSGKEKNVETTTKGNISISVDEGYKPVIEQQLKVFDSSFPEGHIRANYKSEKQCFEDLFKDSARLILTSRDLTAAEKKAYTSNGIVTRSLGVAMDAIAVIVNPKSADSFMTVGQLKEVLQGKFARTYTVVFDNAQSGTVRYMLDSLIPGKELSSKSYATKDNEAVIDYVAQNENAIGLVGVNHVYDPEDKSGIGAFKKNVKVVAMMNDSTGEFYQPYQAYIALMQYPLSRTLFFITRDTWQGLGAGFANFLCSQRGQMIFNKARLVPLRVQLTIRETEIK
jgi:phosphate transport system substrate-binding protein